MHMQCAGLFEIIGTMNSFRFRNYRRRAMQKYLLNLHQIYIEKESGTIYPSPGIWFTENKRKRAVGDNIWHTDSARDIRYRN